ncbi:DUF6276 family protein [Natronorubrum thiooxidans]|uniref:Small CPxCG-related zinc finger protein n=1 Tax=Natronorubrum thiooxidans TaxID=308853 RepID=A0A1N7CR92_9EURY|nr:DUF6276 family protein [Natronorubrum thiooxidans]SIR66017.1 hypothetical protein SAMN05421752_101525 [Natronorubrum thiooxidans]
MACSECGAPTIVFSVPEEYQACTPGESAAATLCTRCLTVESTSVESTGESDFTRVSDAFPTAANAAVPLALALGLCPSLATNRSAIETLLEAVERAGTDPLLVLDRLGDEPSIEPAFALERRRHQLEQLLY